MQSPSATPPPFLSVRAQQLPQLGPEFLQAFLCRLVFLSGGNSTKTRPVARHVPIVGLQVQDLEGSIECTLSSPNGFKIAMAVTVNLSSNPLWSTPVDAAVDVQALKIRGVTQHGESWVVHCSMGSLEAPALKSEVSEGGATLWPYKCNQQSVFLTQREGLTPAAP